MENEDQEFLDEFDENLEEIAAEGKDLSRVAKHSSKIRDQMSENFDSIIKEVRGCYHQRYEQINNSNSTWTFIALNLP